MDNLNLKKKILYGVVIFIISYPLFLAAWIHIKPYYGKVLGAAGVRLSALTTGVKLKTIKTGKDKTDARLEKPILTDRGLADVQIRLYFSTSSYSFNVPLTLALLAALYPFTRWKFKNIAEALILLASVHLLYIYSYSTYQTLVTVAKYGGQQIGLGKQLFWEFLWSFVDNMVIRFEPFLIAFYLWARSGHKTVSHQKDGQQAQK